jgi:hypothetical protein
MRKLDGLLSAMDLVDTLDNAFVRGVLEVENCGPTLLYLTLGDPVPRLSKGVHLYDPVVRGIYTDIIDGRGH